MNFISSFINTANGVLYYPILVVLLVGCGLYFTIRTKGLQFTLFKESVKVITEKPKEGGVSSFQALMVSTASRVGTGNIVGVANAICLGGYGAVFLDVVHCFGRRGFRFCRIDTRANL
ncbi:MAG: alanine:cation symporter family protein [Treponemataceae bacterium]